MKYLLSLTYRASLLSAEELVSPLTPPHYQMLRGF